MFSALRQFGITRLLASLLFGAVLLGCMYGFHRGWSSDGYRVPGALDLSGEWEFHNGAYSPYEALAMPFYERVEVPKPLPAAIKEKLAEEFWYRKRFKLPAVSGPLAISFGTIKGESEIYWNGRYIGSGAKTGWVALKVPNEYLNQSDVTVSVRVKAYKTQFPGIVNLYAVQLGDAELIATHTTKYYFELGVKPILAAIIKLIFALLFAVLYLAAPSKREYLPFAFFALFSSAGAASTTKFLPIYDDFYFKNAAQFFFGAMTLSLVPIFTAAFLRLSESHRSIARVFGFSSPLIFLLAAFLVPNSEQLLAVYRISNEWMPLLVGFPSITACIYCFWRIDKKLAHRKTQITVFGTSLLVGLLAWGSFASKYQSFQLFRYPEYLDLLVFVGLASALILDFQVVSRRSEKAGKTIPKWFSGFLATGTKEVKFEIPMIALAVDTVGYTKKLVGLNANEKDELHREIRGLLQPLVEHFGAQKLSDGGDGGIFAWDQPVSKKEWEEIIQGVKYISQARGERFAVEFRVGMAAGSVRCSMSGSDFSFMGDALNVAARLESISKPGEPLVDGSVVQFIDESLLNKDWVEAELKGVVYRGRSLRLAA